MKETDKPHNSEIHTETVTPPPAPKRDEKGRWLKGASGNPGGWQSLNQARHKQFIALIKEKTNNGQAMVDLAYKTMTADGVEIRDRLAALNWLADRGFGRVLTTRDMPEDIDNVSKKFSGETDSPQELLARSLKLLSRVLGSLEQQTSGGESLDGNSAIMLSESTKMLTTLAKEEREIARSGPGASLSDEELKKAVVGTLSKEELERALSERNSKP